MFDAYDTEILAEIQRGVWRLYPTWCCAKEHFPDRDAVFPKTSAVITVSISRRELKRIIHGKKMCVAVKALYVLFSVVFAVHFNYFFTVQ